MKKISISRQSIYLLSLSVILLIFVLVFSFFVLIPKGKEYRNKRSLAHKERFELKKYEDIYDKTLKKFQKLKETNRHTIVSFETSFNEKRFEKLYKKYFISLDVEPKKTLPKDDGFLLYEVNATTSINSPKSFYNFLDALNKADWIVGVNFPIHFKREGEFIKSSFTMKVYKSDSKK